MFFTVVNDNYNNKHPHQIKDEAAQKPNCAILLSLIGRWGEKGGYKFSIYLVQECKIVLL